MYPNRNQQINNTQGNPTNYKPKNQQTRLLPAKKPQTNFSNVFCNNFTTKIKEHTENIRSTMPVPKVLSPEEKLKRHIIISIEKHQKGYAHDFSKKLGSIVKDIITNEARTDKKADMIGNDNLEKIKSEVFQNLLTTNFNKHTNAFPLKQDISDDIANEIVASMADENATFLYNKLIDELEIITAEVETYLKADPINLNKITYGTFLCNI